MGQTPGAPAPDGPPAVAPAPNTCLPGTGSRNWCGDGRPATSAKLGAPADISLSPGGSLFIADTLNNVIRRVRPDGVMETVAGDGYSDGARAREPAATAAFEEPGGVAVEAGGSVLVADTGHHAVRRISPQGEVEIVVGGRERVGARLRRPGDVVALPDGGMLIADTGHHRVLRVTAAATVQRLVGTGRPGHAGDGRPAAQARLRAPTQLALIPGGGLLIADTGNDVIRRVTAEGVIRTVAGGRRGRGRVRLRSPSGVALVGRRILASDERGVYDVTRPRRQARVAGTGRRGFTGDSGAATRTALDEPGQLAVAPDGLLIAERGSDRVRRLRGGELATLAGTDVPLPAPRGDDVPLPPPPDDDVPLPAPPADNGLPVLAGRDCSDPHTRFRIFVVKPQFTPLRGTRRRVVVDIESSRRARAALTLRRAGRRKAGRSLIVSDRRRRRVVVKARFRRGATYRLHVRARAVDEPIVRCDTRRVRIRRH